MLRRIAAIALAGCLMGMGVSDSVAASRADKRLSAAQSAFQAGNFSRAISRFSDIISAGSYGKAVLAQAFYYRGLAFQRSGKPIEALADFTNALWLEGLPKPVHAQCLIRRGYLRLEQSQNDAALEDMNSAVRTLDDAESHMARAKVLVATGKPEAAIKDLALAEQMNPNRKWFLHMVRAEALDGLGRRGEALSEARAAIEIIPDRKYAPLNRLYARLGGHGGRQLAGRPVAGPDSGLTTGSIRRSSGSEAGDWAKATRIDPAAPAAKRGREAAAVKALSGKSGDYVLQLAASRSLEAAKKAVHRMARLNRPLLAGHDLFVVKGLDRSNQRVFRVRLGPFNDRTKPAGICARLKSSGQDCFVTRR
ncbi:MAG: hypothetical protein C0605_05840 [Hyphomicrobiales bacterium]|nr:MAG: hypothetical protein C0605_05840 [Hyphomicrobiales bacterium]